MNPSLVSYISKTLNLNIDKITSVPGGDISQSYRIQAESIDYFVKVNRNESALTMFETEKVGLQLIASTKAIATPEVIDIGKFENYSYLILEHIDSKSATIEEMQLFGRQLARMNQITSKEFGLDSDNFIGSLPQSNNQKSNWTDFYCEERLWPQLKLSEDLGLLASQEIPLKESLKNPLKSLFNNVNPSLLHGDLWSGNYLISKQGIPYIIDPAVYYGDPLIDIAMSKLFGGFGDSFYNAYLQESDLHEFSSEKIELYQLYYLLVHLNLFGRSYYGSVKNILDNYF